MSAQTIEERLTAVEAELQQLKREKEQNQPQEKHIPWWEQIRGEFKNDPMYDEAMRRGREWRELEDRLDEGDQN